ncbi:MAG: hypothetical protein QM723_01920 [Myxococcaceae bacterium]
MKAKSPGEKAQLEKAIFEGTQGAWEVYADWLQSQGDPKGELAALVMKKPERVNAWLKPRRPALFGELAMLLEDSTIEVRQWHPGFVKTLKVKPNPDNNDDLGVLLTELLAAPICTFVDGLIVNDSASVWAGGLEALVKSAQAQRLTRLEVSSTDGEGGDLSKILPRLPKLERLTIDGDNITVAEKNLELPNVTSLTWSVQALGDEPRILARAKLPKLSRFELAVGYEEEGDFEIADELAPVKCISKLLSAGTLRELVLSGLTFDETRLEQLLESDGLTKLHLLDLDACFVQHDAVEMLREHVPLLQRIAQVRPPRAGDGDENEDLELDLGYDEAGGPESSED